MSQTEDVVPIGLYTGFSDPLDLWGMSDDGSINQGSDLVIDLPGIGGGFEDNVVSGEQVCLSPGRPFLKGYSAWIEDYLLLPVDASNDQIVLVQVESQEAL
jgi:hypothetical protein